MAKKHIAGIISILLLACVMLSSFYVVKEQNHDCSGEDCPICLQMEQCETVLRRVAGGLVTIAVMVITAMILYTEKPAARMEGIFQTPVSCKVRLNN